MSILFGGLSGFTKGQDSMKILGCLLTLTLGAGTTAGLAAQSEIEGRWAGSINVGGNNLEISVSIQRGETGLTATIDIPAQGAVGLPLAEVSYDPPTVHFVIAGVPGAPTFDGTYEDDTISGDFVQGGVNATFTMTRSPVGPPEVVVEDLPYAQEEVQFTNGDVTLAGTLTVPESPGPHAAVVLISGSGPQNRDEELFGFRPFRVIADHFTRNGIAVLRYDDRGVGGSSGKVSESTSRDFAEDVMAGVRLLQARTDIDAANIGLLGHSEGGIVAPMAAVSSDDVAFVVMLAGPAMSGAEILYAQGELIARANGADQQAVDAQREMQDLLFAALRTGQGWDRLEGQLREQVQSQLDAMPPEQRATISDPAAFIKTQVDAQINGVDNEWFRFFLHYDPRPALAALQVPALGIFGELDLQVPAQPNYDVMEETFAASGLSDYQLTILPNANHLFIAAQTGSPSEYATLQKEFVPELLPFMTTWILDLTK